MAVDHTLALLQEMRGEARAFHEETRKNFGVVFNRLNVLEATVASLKAAVAARPRAKRIGT